MEHTDSPVSGFSPTQLVTFLTNLDISRTGLDSVWEKEVTGAMLCEFCEEDIKDVFTEFKDRFRIRKLLRDIADKVRHKPLTTSLQFERNQDLLRTAINISPAHKVLPKVEAVSSVLNLSSSDHKFNIAVKNHPSSVDDSRSPHSAYSPHTSSLELSEEKNVKKEIDSVAVKRQRVENSPCSQPIPEAHSNSQNFRQTLPPSQRSAADAFVPPPSVSLFLNKPDFLSCFMSSHPMLTAGYPSSNDQRKGAGPSSDSEEQALCLKKSPQRIVSPAQTRSEAASPATQPSSTTPDYLNGVDPSHVDIASVMAMGNMAAKYSAKDILSKKGQRSRPNSAQKLGSILIRSAAQQANLWSSPPHLRSISQTQKQQFLSTIYHVAPHIREHEHLLWQRLSETLQNRRKYLLDKKLGKRGIPTSGKSVASSSSFGDLSDMSEWQVTSVQSHLSNLREDGQDDINILNEVAASEDCLVTTQIKTEPVS